MGEHDMGEHDKGEHDWWSEEIKAKYYRNQCDSEFNNRDIFTDQVDTAHSDDSDRIKLEIIESSEQVKSEYYDISNYPDIKNE